MFLHCAIHLSKNMETSTIVKRYRRITEHFIIIVSAQGSISTLKIDVHKIWQKEVSLAVSYDLLTLAGGGGTGGMWLNFLFN
jgi:hypothetical protein